MKATVIGGGIIGLSTAFYLQQSGWDVTVLDKDDFLNNCSYGNMGYVCPSHFIPLATPGIVKQGLKWMFNSESPFYVQPRLNGALIDWGMKFMRSARPEKVAAAAVPLRDIALISQQAYQDWTRIPGFAFAYEHKGLLELFQTEKVAEHAAHTVQQGKDLGLDVDLLSAEEVKALEPQTTLNAIGAILFRCDGHLYPNKLMHALLELLRQRGVKLVPHAEVSGFEKTNGKITRVFAGQQEYETDVVVIAAGSWSRELAAMADTRIALVPGRGYSVTLEDSPYTINHPAILVEGRTAMTPMDGNKIRFGGTMEITSTDTPPRINRVKGILNAVKRFFPDFDVPMPPVERIWYGYRPCSADGLPYIGRTKKYQNLVLATGHSMLGLSLGAGTGKLVSQVVNGQKTDMDLSPFAVERFA